MSDIQTISITGTETVTSPKPHTVYLIEVSTPIRTWTVQRRYNDFVALHAELVSSAGKEPPASLPPKHPWRVTRSAYDDKTIRERRVLLEAYLRSILNHRDPRWRQTFTFPDFLGYPTASSSARPAAPGSSSDPFASSASAAPDHWTASNWLSEHAALQALLRQSRAALLKRDALAGMGDAAGSRGAGVEAKKVLRETGERVDGLERGLGAVRGLGAGEKKRREELVLALRGERGDLQRMAEAGVRTAFAREREAQGTTDSPAHGQIHRMPGAYVASHPPERVFGAAARHPPQETEATRPLDDRGVLQLQQTQVESQDDQLRELSRLLQKQRRMGEEIHSEVEQQNEMLDEIEGGVDKTQNKLGKAKRQLNRLG